MCLGCHGAAGQACEIANLESHLFGDYFGNDGGWGQFNNTFGGSSWTGEYSAPSFDPIRPSDLVLQWRGKVAGQCPVPTVARVSGCVEEELREVRFVFTQGDRPKQASDTLVDVRTAGTGTVTYLVDPTERESGTFDVEEVGGNVVRELDYAVDHGTAIKTKQLKLKPITSEIKVTLPLEDPGPNDELATRIILDLEVVKSSDPRCSEKKDGQPRGARLLLHEGDVKDAVRLTVPGCPEQNFLFKGKKKVKVALVLLTPPQ